jgi:GNAT superfamily N-acetyltransferase
VNTITVRMGESRDADAIADAHVWGWRVGYRGLFPDDFLDADEFDTSRRTWWRAWQWHEWGGPTSRLFVGAVDERVVAFGHCGPERVEGTDGTITRSAERGEVYGFYAHPDAWGSGVAAALMTACDDHLRGIGYPSAVLWMLCDNPRAQRFYTRAGWRAHGVTGRFEWRPGDTVAEVQLVRDLIER